MKLAVVALLPAVLVVASLVWASVVKPPGTHPKSHPPVATAASIVTAYKNHAARGGTQIHGSLALAVGANACLDLIADAKTVVRALEVNAVPAPRDHATIDDMDQFLAVFGLFAAAGKAAERFVTNETLFDRLVRAATPSGRFSVGGNAALMAQGADQRGVWRVLLGGLAGEKLRELLGPQIEIVGPSDAKDQIHLILEYSKGQEVLPGVHAPRSNRFIVSADYANARQAAAAPFFASLPSFRPSVVVFSGLHMLDGVPKREERRAILRNIQGLVKGFRSHAPAVPLHFEFASIGDKSLVDDILQLVAGEFHSIGCNEEELWSLYAATSGKVLQREHFSHSPSRASVEIALEHVFANLPQRVSRIHFHSLGLHVIALRRARSDSFWSSDQERSAVVTGALVTSMRVCDTHIADALSLNEFEVITDLSSNLQWDPAASWSGSSVDFLAAPTLVCKQPKGTVGAGDSISSAALVQSVEAYLKTQVVAI